MKKYNIMGYEMVKVADLNALIRRLRRRYRTTTFPEDDPQRVLDAVVREVYWDEIKEAKSEDEVDTILETKGDFVVYKQNELNRYDITYFQCFADGKHVLTRKAPLAMHFDYESMASHIAEALGDGWKVLDLHPDACADDMRMLKAILGEGEDNDHT